MVTRAEIEHHVNAIVPAENIDRWWRLHMAKFGGVTAEEALVNDPDGLLRHVKSYSDPSFL